MPGAAGPGDADLRRFLHDGVAKLLPAVLEVREAPARKITPAVEVRLVADLDAVQPRSEPARHVCDLRGCGGRRRGREIDPVQNAPTAAAEKARQGIDVGRRNLSAGTTHT